ncbi:MAG TPA: hypothetical protein VKP61_11915 [Candidatus Acidoferrum sp.]|nr:hypothetical protein [Candidatus Acidoferrum sp.]
MKISYMPVKTSYHVRLMSPLGKYPASSRPCISALYASILP